MAATSGNVAAASDATAANDTAVGDATAAASDGANCGLSFAADTPVATPHGAQPIASLTVGDHVLTYNPTTGKQSAQTIVRVFLNHDHDRLDVTLKLPRAQNQPAFTATISHATTDAERARERARAVAGHGLRAPPDASVVSLTATQLNGAAEVIHTTAHHPWLTTDRSWLLAGGLRVGEPVRLLDGGTATVVGLYALPGVGPMWDLSLESVRTFAVGAVCVFRSHSFNGRLVACMTRSSVDSHGSRSTR
ncbi:MAG TPA: Hint domain-containing protein [Ktedonobacterales bacterium]